MVIFSIIYKRKGDYMSWWNNYEDEFISMSELKKALNLFNKKPSDFGIEEENQAVDDLEDLMEYLEGTEDDEAKHC